MLGRDHRPRDNDEVHREEDLRRAVAALEAPRREYAVRPPRCEPSTASTFTSEFRMLKEAPHAPRGYVYAAMMLLAGQVAAIPFVASIPSM